MAKPILNLNTFADRPTIVIGEKEYWLITPDILPPLQSHQFAQWFKRSDELVEKSELSEEEKTELERIPDRLCRLVLEASDDVHVGLDDRMRMLIVQTAATTFRNGLRTIAPMTAAPDTSQATPSTGNSSSPAS